MQNEKFVEKESITPNTFLTILKQFKICDVDIDNLTEEEKLVLAKYYYEEIEKRRNKVISLKERLKNILGKKELQIDKIDVNMDDIKKEAAEYRKLIDSINYLKKENERKLKEFMELKNERNEQFKNFLVSPYTILGLVEGDYSKEELLSALNCKISVIQNSQIENKQFEIDKVLDAYNELIKKKRLR